MAVSDITTIINKLSKGTPENALSFQSIQQKMPEALDEQVEVTVLI
jgi:hypothetical protein